MEEKSKPITGMRRNELVDVEKDGEGWRRAAGGLWLKLTYLRLQL